MRNLAVQLSTKGMTLKPSAAVDHVDLSHRYLSPLDLAGSENVPYHGRGKKSHQSNLPYDLIYQHTSMFGQSFFFKTW